MNNTGRQAGRQVGSGKGRDGFKISIIGLSPHDNIVSREALNEKFQIRLAVKQTEGAVI